MSLVQVVSKNLTALGTTQTTAAINTTPHNVLVFFAVYNATAAGAVTPSDSTSQTWIQVAVSPYLGGATGLTLAIWYAQNIAGNAANTFTFATAGSDTPTIFIAEDSGRDLIFPVYYTATGSDTVANAGSHSTGVTVPGSGDDIIAFTVSSSLAQSYASAGAWAIPPNGTITSATGYDAFVQYQNGVNAGAIANVYSVTISDKLDAMIIALRPTTQFSYSDEYHDQFNEAPEVSSFSNGYQQYDVLPQFLDVYYDWSEDSGENDVWVGVEDQSSIVGANVVGVSTQQYFGEDAELLDEVPELVTFSGGSQNADNFPPIALEEPWDWFQEIDDDEWVFRDESNVQNPNVVDLTSQVIADFTDWDEDPDEFFADDFGNDDADLPQNDVWDHWPTDDDEQVLDDIQQLISFVAPLPYPVEDGWDQEHFLTQDFDEQWTEDNYENDPNPLLNLEDAWDWFLTDEDDYVVIDDYASVNNNPIVNVEDPWDWTQDEDDYVVVDDYQIVDFIGAPLITVEDAFDWFPNDPDDETYQSLDADPVGPTLVIPFSMPPEDPWDQTQAEDDYFVPDNDYTNVDVAPSLQVPVDDAWDWSNTDDDDYFIDDPLLTGNNTPIVAEDAWEHCVTDADDEWFVTFEWSIVEPFTALNTQGDGWDYWTQDADDEEWAFRDCDAVPPFGALSTQTDGWDHFPTDEDDYHSGDDYARTDLVIPPSQFTDDNFDWFYEPAEDNDQDYALEPAKLPDSVYSVNPNYEVYMTMRTFTVIWLPAEVNP